MIGSYEIKNINGKQILYLYLDLNSEFAMLNFKRNSQKLEDVIRNFIRENKIVFTGTIVTLIIGNTLLGNINLNDNEVSSLNNSIIEKKIDDISFNDIDSLKTDEIKVEEDTPILIENDNIIEVQKKESNTVSSRQEKSSSNKTTNQEKKTETTSKEIITKEELKQDEIDNKIYVDVKRQSGEIIRIELEEYVVGVVGAEMPAEFNLEALKSQAIIARTYALNSISQGKFLTDSESTQSYKDNDQLKTLWGNKYDTYYKKIKNAVIMTEGLYLSYNGQYIDAVYHSTSNGYTESSINVWGNYHPYLVSVESVYDSLNPSYEKQKSFTYEEISDKLDMDINYETNFDIISKTPSGRVESISINDKIYKGIELRNILGLRSTDFDIEKKDESIIFITRGYGHGVGLSQYGANGMAKAGYTYEQILKHYYSGVSINHL